MKNRMGVLAVLLTTVFFVSIVNANTINYGDLTGVNMNFLNLHEASLSVGDTAPLYGAPQLVGDSLVFTQMNFSSDSQNGAIDITDGQFNGTIESKNNEEYYIDKIKFQEFGDVTLTGTGTNATRASVASNIYVTVLEIDGVSLPSSVFIFISMVMSDNGGWDLANDGAFTGRLWDGILDLDITTTLAERGITGRATRLDFTINNTLATQSETNTRALIAKKVAGLQVTPEIIPEPATVLILGLGAIAIRRRKK